MRRTLFVFPRDLLPAAWGSAAARVAAQQHKQLAEVRRPGRLPTIREAWLDKAYARRLAALADGEPRTTTQLRELVPVARRQVHDGHARQEVGRRVPDRARG